MHSFDIKYPSVFNAVSSNFSVKDQAYLWPSSIIKTKNNTAERSRLKALGCKSLQDNLDQDRGSPYSRTTLNNQNCYEAV